MIVLALALAAAEPATCVFDTAPPEPCTIRFASDGKGGTQLHAEGKAGHKADFAGKRGSGWWAGTLNGAPAMGYERNRGNVVFSTSTLDRSFQYWTRGSEHGNY